MTELSRKHGKVKRLSPTSAVTKWAQEISPSISKHNFDGLEAAASRLKKNSDEKTNR